MRDYGKIKTSIWESKKFTGLKSDDLRLFYLYLHTCPHVNSIGCFRLKIGYIMADLGWSAKVSDRAIVALCEANLIRWDSVEHVVLICNFLTESPITNKKHGAGAAKLALSLPECKLKHDVIGELMTDKYACDLSEWKGYDRPINSGTDTTEPETEPERETEPDNIYISKFPEFWDLFPRQRRGNKDKAEAAYDRALKEKRAGEGEILYGVRCYAQSSEVAKGWAKGAAAWLNDDRWTVDYSTEPTPSGGGQSNAINDAFDEAAQKLREGTP